MSSILLLVISIVIILFGYFIFARYVDRRVVITDNNNLTPAEEYVDGIDFMPADKFNLFTYQFKSIVGLGVVIGVIVSLQWGWLPAFGWLVLGVFFIGWQLDYFSIILSVRNQGQTIGGLIYNFVSPRSRFVLLIFLCLYLFLVISAFTSLMASALVKNHSLFLPIVVFTLAGLITGELIYKKQLNSLLAVFLSAVIFFVGLGIVCKYLVLDFTGFFSASAFYFWVIFVLVYGALGAILPIWRWTQPINYFSSFIVMLTLILVVLGIIIIHPKLAFPVFTAFKIPSFDGAELMWPFLFIMMACGACSGWHSLVSTSGTSHQLAKEKDALFIGAGTMFLEMLVGVIVLIVVASAFQWQKYADYLPDYSGGPLGIFTEALGKFLSYLPLSSVYLSAFISVVAISLGLSLIQLQLRFLRGVFSELFEKSLMMEQNIYFGIIIPLVFILLLVASSSWTYLWIIFGGVNMLLAALVLIVISLWLLSQKKNCFLTVVPLLFLFITSVFALVHTSYKIVRKTDVFLGSLQVGNILAGIIAFAMVICAFIIFYDGAKAFFTFKKASAGIGK